MNYSNEQLRDMQHRINKLDNIRTQLSQILKKQEEALKKLKTSEEAKLKKEKEIEKLEGFGFKSMLYSIKGDKIEQLNKEKDEAYELRLKYEKALKEYNSITDNADFYRGEIRNIAVLEEKFDNEIKKRSHAVKSENAAIAAEVRELENTIERIYIEISVIDEYMPTATEAKDIAAELASELEYILHLANEDIHSVFFEVIPIELRKTKSISTANKYAKELDKLIPVMRSYIGKVYFSEELVSIIESAESFFGKISGKILTGFSGYINIYETKVKADKIRDLIVGSFLRLEENRSGKVRYLKDTKAQLANLFIND